MTEQFDANEKVGGVRGRQALTKGDIQRIDMIYCSFNLSYRRRKPQRR